MKKEKCICSEWDKKGWSTCGFPCPVHNKKMKQSKLPLAKLKRKAKKLFFAYIKKRDGNTCISCGKRGLVGQNWHAGHYLKSELCNLEYMFNEKNVNSQCGRCNLWLRGNTIEYRKAMLLKYGKITVKVLEEHYKDTLPTNFNKHDFYCKLIEKYEKYKV